MTENEADNILPTCRTRLYGFLGGPVWRKREILILNVTGSHVPRSKIKLPPGIFHFSRLERTNGVSYPCTFEPFFIFCFLGDAFRHQRRGERLPGRNTLLTVSLSFLQHDLWQGNLSTKNTLRMF